MVARLSLIVARGRNNVIGSQGDLPWRMKGDLYFFKRVTMGKPMVMGRKTFESLPGLLPGRPHLVVTRNADWSAQGATSFTSLDQAVDAARALHDEEIFVIGGGELYRLALPFADRLYITEVDASPDGDTYFPSFDEAVFEEVERIILQQGEGNAYSGVIRVLDRRK